MSHLISWLLFYWLSVCWLLLIVVVHHNYVAIRVFISTHVWFSQIGYSFFQFHYFTFFSVTSTTVQPFSYLVSVPINYIRYFLTPTYYDPSLNTVTGYFFMLSIHNSSSMFTLLFFIMFDNITNISAQMEDINLGEQSARA